MSAVVPGDAGTADLSVEDVRDFREQRLRAKRMWRTPVGDTVLVWFWISRLGRWFRRRFRDATPREFRGYQFWGPVALFITTIELLGLGKIASFDYWPTISTTVGDLQDRDSRWGLLVVGLIALAAFYAVAYRHADAISERPEYVLRGAAGAPNAIGYTWRIVVAVTTLVAVIAGVSLDEKIHRGYAIYATVALVALVIPFALALPWKGRHRVAFPNLFYTFSVFRSRFAALTGIAIALLAILVLHLALYPWPDLARTPGRFAGVSAREARERAVGALHERGDAAREFAFSTSQRSVHAGQDAWHIHFNELIDGEPHYGGCYVIVTVRGSPTLSDGCTP